MLLDNTVLVNAPDQRVPLINRVERLPWPFDVSPLTREMRIPMNKEAPVCTVSSHVLLPCQSHGLRLLHIKSPTQTPPYGLLWNMRVCLPSPHSAAPLRQEEAEITCHSHTVVTSPTHTATTTTPLRQEEAVRIFVQFERQESATKAAVDLQVGAGAGKVQSWDG